MKRIGWIPLLLLCMVPGWGFASSPLVVDDVVIVAVSGRLVAYDASGELRWIGPKGGGSYSSPHRLMIDGVDQVVLQNSDGISSFAPGEATRMRSAEWRTARARTRSALSRPC